MRATYNGTVIAESEDVYLLEGYHYFPREDVRPEYLVKSDHHTACPWKGQASYYHVRVDDVQSDNAAWYYPVPSPAAKEIIDRIAFWKDVIVEEVAS